MAHFPGTVVACAALHAHPGGTVICWSPVRVVLDAELVRAEPSDRLAGGDERAGDGRMRKHPNLSCRFAGAGVVTVHSFE